MAVKELTAPELAILRAGGRFSIYGLAIHGMPATVFACRVNQTFDTLDGVADVTYDGVTVGAFGDVLPGMTCYVGSALGLYDLGMVRVRAAFTSTLAKFGRTSEIPWANDLYLTVVDDFNLWAKPAAQAGSTINVDHDMAFSTATYLGPVACAGPMAAVLRLISGTAAFHPTDVGSWSPLGLSITARLWSAPGASATSGMTGSTPTIIYDAAGTYRVSLRVTDSSGATHTRYMRVFVDPPSPEFILERPEGLVQAGGWSFSVVCKSGVTRDEVRDRGLCALWSRDFYETSEGSAERSEGSVGPLVDYENIEAIGWIDGTSIDWNAQDGSVRFTVQGPAFWLQQIEGQGITLLDTSGTATKWEEIPSLTADRALYHMLRWHTTAPDVMDCFKPGDVNRTKSINVPPATLWEQIREVSERKNLAIPLVDRYGSLWVEYPAWLLPVASRSGITTVQAIARNDYAGQVQIGERRTVPVKGLVEVLGNLPYSGSGSPVVMGARSPGNVPKAHGTLDAPEGRLIFTNEADAKTKAGALLSWGNNEFPSVALMLAASHRGFDIAPRQRATLSIDEGDTPLGITWTAKKLLPQRVTLVKDEKSGARSTEVEFAAETDPEQAVRWVPPVGTTTPFPPIDIPPPVFPPLVPGPGTNFPPVEGPPPGGTDDCSESDAGENGPWPLVWDVGTLDAANGPQWASAAFSATLRPGTYDYNSYLYIGLTGYGNWASHIHLYAALGNTIVATGVFVGMDGNFMVFQFSGVTSPTPMDNFKLHLDGDADTDFSLVLGSEFGIFDIDPNRTNGTPIPDVLGEVGSPETGLVAGNHYALKFTGGDINGYNTGDSTGDHPTISIEAWDEQHSDFQYSMSGGVQNLSGRLGGYTGGTREFDGYPQEDYIFEVLPVGALQATVIDDGGSRPGMHTTTTMFFRVSPEAVDGGWIRARAMFFPNSVRTNCLMYIYNAVLTGDRRAFIGGSYVINVCGT